MSEPDEAGSEGTPPQRGRPRSERARAAILKAAGELLLEHGPGAASMDAVAERAGVSKATIYRWWSHKEALALDALYAEWSVPSPPDTGQLRGDLIALLAPWVAILTGRSFACVTAALIGAAGQNPEFGERYRASFIEPRRAPGREILRRAKARGELRAAIDGEVALDLIYGALYHRMLNGHAPLSQHFVEQVVDTALAGIARAHGSPSGDGAPAVRELGQP